MFASGVADWSASGCVFKKWTELNTGRLKLERTMITTEIHLMHLIFFSYRMQKLE